MLALKVQVENTPPLLAERGAKLSLACSLRNQLELFIRVVSLEAKRKAPWLRRRKEGRFWGIESVREVRLAEGPGYP